MDSAGPLGRFAFSWLTYAARAHWSAADSQAPLRGVSIAKAIVRHTCLSLPGRAIPDRRAGSGCRLGSKQAGGSAIWFLPEVRVR